MAIKGSVVLEDVAVTWTNSEVAGVELASGEVFVTVTELDPATGSTKSDSFISDGAAFSKAIALAIAWDGEVPKSEEEHKAWWDAAESVMAISKIRFIP